MFYQRLCIFLNFRKCFRGFTEPLARRKPNASEDCQRRLFGLIESFLWIGLRRAEGSTSCRRLVIEMASARRFDNERSPCKRWGLDVSVKAKEKFSWIKENVLLNQGKGWVKAKERLAYAELRFSKSKGENCMKRIVAQKSVECYLNNSFWVEMMGQKNLFC